MIRLDRRSTLIAAVLLAGVVVAAWCVGVAFAARDAARLAGADVADCERFRETVLAARGVAPVARDREMGTAEVSRTLDAALAAAKIETSSLIRVTPSPPVHLANTPYEERPTQLTLRDVTYAQAIEFLLAFRVAGSDLNVRAVRLAATKPASNADAWTADVTVSYLIYTGGRNDLATNAEDR